MGQNYEKEFDAVGPVDDFAAVVVLFHFQNRHVIVADDTRRFQQFFSDDET